MKKFDANAYVVEKHGLKKHLESKFYGCNVVTYELPLKGVYLSVNMKAQCVDLSFYQREGVLFRAGDMGCEFRDRHPQLARLDHLTVSWGDSLTARAWQTEDPLHTRAWISDVVSRCKEAESRIQLMLTTDLDVAIWPVIG